MFWRNNMPAKKKTSAKKKVAPPKACLRQVDPNTQIVSDDPRFKEVEETTEEKLKKGYVRVDKNTIVKA
jgi:hypothetical protein